MRGIRPNWLLGYLIPTIYILGGEIKMLKSTKIILITAGVLIGLGMIIGGIALAIG